MQLYKRGKVWWVRFAENGQEVRRSLHTRDRREARHNLKELERNRTAAVDGVLTIGQLMSRWLEHKRLQHHAKPNSVRAYAASARLLTSHMGTAAADNLSEDLIDEFKATRLAGGTAHSTINLNLDRLGNALRWGQQRGLIGRVPKITKLRQMRRRIPKFLDPDAVGRLLRACQDGGPLFNRVEVIIRLVLNTGLRRAECIWLTWGDVDLTTGWVRVQEKGGWTPKVSDERSVPITEEFVGWLERHRDQLQEAGISTGNGDWVAPFLPLDRSRRPPSRERPADSLQWNEKVLGGTIRRLFDAAGVEPRGSHTLHLCRSTFATNVLQSGGDLESLRALLGHADLKTTSVYLTSTDASLRRAVSGLRLPA